MKLEELKVYQIAKDVGDTCWFLVSKWNSFEKDTIGKQLVRASDSIAANISEGFGRYHYKENRHFNFIACGSLFETKTWLEKAAKRDLVSDEDFLKLKVDMNELGRLLNGYIKKIGKESIVSEPETSYVSRNFVTDHFELAGDINVDEIPFTNDQ